MAEAATTARLFSPKSTSIVQHHRSCYCLSLFPNNINNNKSFSLSTATAFPSRWPHLSCSSLSNSHFQALTAQANPQSKSQVKIMSSSGIIGKAQRWWEKGLQPNMKEVKGAQDLVDSLLNAGDKLVVVDFFSPGCGGCKALHPKICQLAEMNPDVQFLQVNYEEHKSMCYSLNVHVLPFFRFYRGALGRLCSFSCTNATIKKFKDALAKYGADFCSLEPTKGLEEKELLALAANRDLCFNYTPKPQSPVVAPEQEEILIKQVAASPRAESQHPLPLPLPLPLPSVTLSNAEQGRDARTSLSAGR
ncbi:hypothetical protein ACH5RR_002512 [Cinchona calisaya]|uniref:Thioredoxin domain-containing protein n=1 Tax=Cinchona calisaya TaxID=153742 RepID=A0ABD3B6N7_9GENT